MKRTFSLLAFAGMLSLAACTDEDGARRTAEAHGLNQVEITGYRYTGCSDQDAIRTGFRATAPNGKHVTGVVCSNSIFGWGKTNTLRLD